MKIDWGYISGFFDGEGTVKIPLDGKRHLPMLIFYQNHKGSLEDIASFLFEYGIFSKLEPVKRKKKKNLSHQLVVRRIEDVERLSNFMMPYLRVKESVVRDLLRFRKFFPAFTPQQCGMLKREAHAERKQSSSFEREQNNAAARRRRRAA